MKTILFNPYKDRWICKFSKNDIKNREILICILESRGMKIYYNTRSHDDIELYPCILHRTKREIKESTSNAEIIGIMTTGCINNITVSFSFIVYYFSQNQLPLMINYKK